jgi:hypothetical protein
MFKPGTGDSLSALGDDIYAGAGDELNFFRVIEKSKRAFGEALDPAQRLYDVISRRMKGRFSSGGLQLGKFFLLSSAQYPDDFIERRIREAEEAGELGRTVKLVRKSIWEAKRGVFIQGNPVFSGRTFRVEVGSSRRGSRMLDQVDKKTGTVAPVQFSSTAGPVEGKVIDPPVELYDDFYRDIEGSVRDFAGEVTRAINPFFSSSDPIYEAIEAGRLVGLEHPWTNEETTLQDGSGLVEKALFTYDEKLKRWKPTRHPSRLRYIHIDLAKNGDACGIGVVHIGDWQTQMRSGARVIEAVYEADMVLRVVAPRGGEIIFDRVLDVVRMLRNHGMSIYSVTYDSWQSVHSIQKLQAEGFRADTLSVDSDISPYVNLKDSFYDKRIRIYKHEVLVTELGRLEKKGEKVDHPSNGSKDVADALCGAAWGAFLNEARTNPDAQEARLPQRAKQTNPMADPVEQRRASTLKEAEDEIASSFGFNRIIR